MIMPSGKRVNDCNMVRRVYVLHGVYLIFGLYRTLKTLTLTLILTQTHIETNSFCFSLGWHCVYIYACNSPSDIVCFHLCITAMLEYFIICMPIGCLKSYESVEIV